MGSESTWPFRGQFGSRDKLVSGSRAVSAAIACDLSPFSRTCVRASARDEEKGFGPCSQMKGIEEMAPDNSPGAHGEVGLTGTSATAHCRACACA